MPPFQVCHISERCKLKTKRCIGLVNGLNIHISQGPDEIHSRMLKVLSNNPVCAVGCLFRSCAHSATIPDTWKRATVIPIFKKGYKSDASNYRPILLMCILCKVYEKLLHNHFCNTCIFTIATRIRKVVSVKSPRNC